MILLFRGCYYNKSLSYLTVLAAHTTPLTPLQRVLTCRTWPDNSLSFMIITKIKEMNLSISIVRNCASNWSNRTAVLVVYSCTMYVIVRVSYFACRPNKTDTKDQCPVWRFDRPRQPVTAAVVYFANRWPFGRLVDLIIKADISYIISYMKVIL